MRNREEVPGTVTCWRASALPLGTFQCVPSRRTSAATPGSESVTAADVLARLKIRDLMRHVPFSPQTNSGLASIRPLPETFSAASRCTVRRSGGVVNFTSNETARSPFRSGSIHSLPSTLSAASGGVEKERLGEASFMRDGNGTFARESV